MIGCVLPSPAWATTTMGVSRSAAIARIPCTSVGKDGTGTPTSSSSSAPSRSMAGQAARPAAAKAPPPAGPAGREALREERAEPLHGREGGPAGGGEGLALVRVGGREDLGRIVRLAGDADLLDLRGGSAAGGVGAGEQQRTGVAVEPHLHEVLDR